MSSPAKKPVKDIRSFFGGGGAGGSKAAKPPPPASDEVIMIDSEPTPPEAKAPPPSASKRPKPSASPAAAAKGTTASKRAKTGPGAGAAGAVTGAGAAGAAGASAVALSPNIVRARAAMARALEGNLLGSGGTARPPSAGAAAKKSPASAAAAAAKKSPASAAAATKAAAAAAYEAPHAAEARAAVLAAAAALPTSTDQLDFSVMEETGGAAGVGTGGGPGRPDDAPPNAGAVPPPAPGHPDAFKGLTFVISGVLDSLHREQAASHIQRHGGRVTGSVSGKTSFLLVGHKAGRSKTAAAARQAATCKVIDEKGLRALIAASVPFKPAEEAEEEEEDEMPLPPATVASAERQQQGVSPSAAAAAARSSTPAARPPSTSAAAAAARSSTPAARPPSTSAAAAGTSASAPPPPSTAPPVTGNRGSDLWVDKHRPMRSSELVGNPGAIGTLRQWLVTWENVHLHGAPVPTPKSGPAANKDLSKKAVLLSGPPGVGKTSAALAVARECGFLPIEVNASDSRGKADSDVRGGIAGKLSNALRELATNRTLGGCGGSGAGGFFGASASAAAAAATGVTKGKGKTALSPTKASARERVCIIMDEVDGMSAGDRGGVSELVAVIKSSKVPIIAIANDKWSQKLKPLRSAALELDFRKPDARTVAKRLAAVCAAEGLQASEATLIALAEGANCDVRSVVGQLQLVRLRKRALSFDDATSGGRFSVSKDATVSPFEASRWLFSPGEAARASMNSRLDAALCDADLVPLLVQENFVNYSPALAQGSARPELTRLRLLARAADGISVGDILGRRVRVGQHWSLMPAAGMMQSVYPAAYVRGSFGALGAYPGEPNFPRFSAWLGQNSSQGKQRRLLAELGARLASSEAPPSGGDGGEGGGGDGGSKGSGGLGIAADRAALRCDYVPALCRTLTRPLAALGAPASSSSPDAPDPIAAIVAAMAEYQLTKDDFDFLLSVTKFRTRAEWGADPYKGVPAAKKAAFTRALTAGAAPTRWNKDAGGFSRIGKKGKKVAGGAGGKAAAKRASTPSADDDDDMEEEEEEEEQFGNGKRSSPVKKEEGGSDDDDALLDEVAKAQKASARLAKRGIVFEAKGVGGGGGGASGSGAGAAAAKGKGKGKKK